MAKTIIHRVEIIKTDYDTWVTFRDQLDCEEPLTKIVQFRGPTITSFHRLLKTINRICRVELVPDDNSFIVYATVNHCPTCGDGDNPPDTLCDAPELDDEMGWDTPLGL